MGRRLCALSLVLGLAVVAHGAAVTVREPAFGLPHIFADTDLELARENGREIAKDRLAQIILLARVGRGTLYQAFAPLDPSTLDGDIEARMTAYTSSELNNMWAKLPVRERDMVVEYCKGVNDTIDAIYAGSLPEPIEVNILRELGLDEDLFGNATNVSDQLDPFYAPPGGDWPNAGFQYTPEMAVAIAILEVRNFGLGGFDENARLAELQKLIAKHGVDAGTEIWSDLNFVNDPLAPVTVPDPTTPGYGGPLALGATPTHLAAVADAYPHYDYAAGARERAAAKLARAEQAMALGAWPKLGSYAWLVAGGKSATGYPWVGGFPQTGIQTPSIMHFVENRSAEGTSNRVRGIGMEFAGAPLVLIGQTDTVAFTTTTAQLPIVDTFLEKIVSENSDVLHYDDEGTIAPMNVRTETFRGGLFAADVLRQFWRTHERGGNGGSRAVIDFLGDKEGTADSGSATTLVDAGAFDASFVGGHVAIVSGTGTGQIRQISAVPNANTLTVGSPWTTAPNNTSVYVAAKAGNQLAAAAVDSAAWQEETTTVLGFAQFQRAETVFDIRSGVRVMPTTHNFFAGDNLPFNAVGTASGTAGNLGYWSSGFSRKRQGGEDLRLPMDGSGPNPLVVASGTVASASANGLSATGSPFTGFDFTPPPLNFRYANPTQLGAEWVVIITTGTGAKQSRRIASNTSADLTVEYDWGVIPAAGDTFEVYEIIAIPEAINPAEGYIANWNNKAATADPGDGFGREFRHLYILEQLDAENAWDRDKFRQLNKDVAGFDGKGKLGRYLLPRIRQAVNRVGNGGNGAVDTVLAQLEAHNASPEVGRSFIDPVLATTVAGEVSFLNSLINQLSAAIYGDEFSGALPTPTGSRAFNNIQHAIDSKEGDPAGAYQQAYSGDYFGGKGTLDAFMCYQARRTKGTPDLEPVNGLALADRFEARVGNAVRPKALCAPGGVDGGSAVDTATHLESYRLNRGAGQAAHVKQTGIVVTDRFGSLSLDTTRPDRLLVPTGKTLDAPATAPTGGQDHLKCYKVKVTSGTPPLAAGTQATVADQFQTRLYDLKRPARLCVPAGVGGAGIQSPLAHLMCYRARRANGQPPHVKVEGHINTANVYGPARLDTIREDELCVPTTIAGDPAQEGWEVTVRAAFSAAASGGIPADGVRPNSRYRHPLAALFPSLEFEPTPQGNRGTYEQIVDVGTTVNGEFIFPLGQSGLIEGSIGGGVTSIDPNVTSLQPIWRDWRFVPMLHVSEDLAGGDEDADTDGVFDGYERWYFGDLTHTAASDDDADGSTLADEFQDGSDPTDADTDDDLTLDGADSKPQDRKIQ